MKKNIQLLMIAAFFVAGFSACTEDPVPPVTGFTYEPAEVTQYDEVTFTNTTTGGTSYAWDFGDGESSTDMSPVHMFTTTGSFTVKLTATNEDGDNDAEQSIDVAAPESTYVIDDTTYTIDAEMFWYQSGGMGGDPPPPYIRLLTTVDGQSNPDLLKLYPNKGLEELPGTYTWSAQSMMAPNPVGTYDCGYTADYAGMSYAWSAIGKTGSGDLVITELVAGVYKMEGTMLLSLGYFDFAAGGAFVETGTADLTVEYVGGITAL